MVESALRIVDEYEAVQVFRARESTPWREDAKRASLDLFCTACRAIPPTQAPTPYCQTHTTQPEPELVGVTSGPEVITIPESATRTYTLG